MTKASDNAFPSVLLVEGSTPTSPSAGQDRLFVDSADHLLKLVNSSGTVTSVGGSSTLTTKGDILTRNSSALARLGVGTDGQVLTADSAQTLGIKWATPSGGSGGITETIYGYNTVGASQEQIQNAVVYLKKVTIAGTEWAYSIEFSLQGGADEYEVFQAAIWSDVSGTPGDLQAVGGGNGSQTGGFLLGEGSSGPYNKRWLAKPIHFKFAAGDYWIGGGFLIGNNTTGMKLDYDTSGSDRKYTASAGSSVADWGRFTGSTTSNKYSIRLRTIK